MSITYQITIEQITNMKIVETDKLAATMINT